jgi:hypothetical protein
MIDKITLLASFITRNDLEETIKKIRDNFTNSIKIFIFKNVDDDTKVILTYNIISDPNKLLQYSKIIPGTISLHRKKETNTMFSVNALNNIVKLENDGILDKNYIINWENYKNCILITSKGSSFLKIRIELEKILK